MLCNKKGVIEVQFNWIFVLIAGALIVLFFIMVVSKQRQLSDSKLAVKVLNQLQTIIAGAEVSTSTASTFQTGSNDVRIDCTGCPCSYIIENLYGSPSFDYNGRVIFAPARLQGPEIKAWALDWNMPFKVTNFLYLTSDGVRYIFVYKDNAAQKIANALKKELPQNIDIEVLPNQLVNFKNVYKVNFVFFGFSESDVLG